MVVIFIPTNEMDKNYLKKGFGFKPLVIEAYKYHLGLSTTEKTQNLLSKKVKTGTVTTNKGSTCVE
jgi:hypothetical protein